MRARVLVVFLAAAQDREDVFFVLAQLLEELGREGGSGAESEAVSGGPESDVPVPDFGENTEGPHHASPTSHHRHPTPPAYPCSQSSSGGFAMRP